MHFEISELKLKTIMDVMEAKALEGDSWAARFVFDFAGVKHQPVEHIHTTSECAKGDCVELVRKTDVSAKKASFPDCCNMRPGLPKEEGLFFCVRTWDEVPQTPLVVSVYKDEDGSLRYESAPNNTPFQKYGGEKIKPKKIICHFPFSEITIP